MSWRSGPAGIRDPMLPFITNLQPQSSENMRTVVCKTALALWSGLPQSDRCLGAKTMINPDSFRFLTQKLISVREQPLYFQVPSSFVSFSFLILQVYDTHKLTIMPTSFQKKIIITVFSYCLFVCLFYLYRIV